MGDTIIITNDDGITVIATPETPSFAIHAEAEGRIVTSAETPSLVVHAEAESHLIAVAEELSVIIQAVEPASVVIEAIGSGGSGGNYFRGIINYDGGFADTLYGDLAHLDGGGAADGRRYSI